MFREKEQIPWENKYSWEKETYSWEKENIPGEHIPGKNEIALAKGTYSWEKRVLSKNMCFEKHLVFQKQRLVCV